MKDDDPILDNAFFDRMCGSLRRHGCEAVIPEFLELCETVNQVKADAEHTIYREQLKKKVKFVLSTMEFVNWAKGAITQGNSMRRYHMNGYAELFKGNLGEAGRLLSGRFRTSTTPETGTFDLTPEEYGLVELAQLNILDPNPNTKNRNWDLMLEGQRNVAQAWIKLVDSVEAQRELKFTADVVPLNTARAEPQEQ